MKKEISSYELGDTVDKNLLHLIGQLLVSSSNSIKNRNRYHQVKSTLDRSQRDLEEQKFISNTLYEEAKKHKEISYAKSRECATLQSEINRLNRKIDHLHIFYKDKIKEILAEAV